jgi:protein disulfide-isomerase A1
LPERYSDSQDFNVDSLEKFVEEASMPLIAVLTKDPDSHAHVIKFFNSPDAKALFFLNFTADNAEEFRATYEELAKSHKGKGLKFLLADLEASQGALQPSILIQDAEDRKYLKETLEVKQISSVLL